ncbi:MAG TPA: glycosyltransferase family 39 protein [Candidatus Limnocylindrales bacterium]|nr:glycosyltransferase family 39 protein [Candidatus Limnocylindrales bacterium]
MRTPIALYLLALIARLVVIGHFPDPAYPDSYYYVDVARNLAAGHGFNVDFVWIFAEVGGKIPALPVLPIPSNAHWMPLASLVQVPFIWLLGPTAVASAVPFALIGALAAPLTWAIARDAGTSRQVAVGAAVLVALPVMLLVFMVQPDNFSLYQPLVAGALWLAARGLRGDARAFALAGLLVGLATLSRNDGVFVGATVGLAFLWDRWRAWRSGGSRRPAIPLWSAVACAALFAVVIAPWIVRQLAVFGSISPSTASGKVLFIRTIEEWNSITTPANLSWLLGQGIGPLVLSRIGGLIAAVSIFTTLACGVVLVLPLVVGAWSRRRSVWFGPVFVYAAILFSFSALVSAVHVPGGTFIHSAVALVPHAFILVLEGIAVGVGWIAARRRAWNRETATRVFTTTAVGFGAVLTILVSFAVHSGWAQKRADRASLGAALAVFADADARVMSIDASGIEYATGHGGVVSPNDPIDAIREAATAYRTEWLILERDSIVAALAPVLTGQARPAWIGAPVLTIAAADGGAPRAALYPICLSPADARCTIVAGGPVVASGPVVAGLAAQPEARP